MRATPLRFSLSFLVDIKCKIQLLTLPFAFVFSNASLMAMNGMLSKAPWMSRKIPNE